MPHRSLRNQILALIILALVLQSIVAFAFTIFVLQNCAEEAAVSKVKGDLYLAGALIDALYPGQWEVKGDRLYKGGTLMNGNRIVNKITGLTGDTCTIFLHDIRIATTVPGPSGKPAIGTRVSEPVHEKVLENGEPYFGHAIVVGKPYQTAYLPLRDTGGQVVGILYVGTPQTQVNHMVRDLLVSRLVLLFILLVILSLVISTASSHWFGPIKSISLNLKAIARGNYNLPLEPARYKEFEGITEAAERMRSDIKRTFNRLNDLSGFGIRAFSLINEEEAYELLIHYLKRLGVDEILVVVIDEGRRKGKVVARYSRITGEEQYFSEKASRLDYPVLKDVELCQAVRTQGPYVVEDVADDLGCRYTCVDPEVKSYVCYPLAIGGRAFGWVRVCSMKPNFFDPEIRKPIEGFVTVTAAVVSNLRLSELNRNLSLTDPLTNLYNRRFLEEYFQRHIAEANRRREAFAIIFLDIDQFKMINDTYGHDVGDRVLATIARTIKGSLREMDLMVRYGGEEFVIVLPNTDLQGGLVVAEKLRQNAASTSISLESGESFFLTVSLGVAEYTPGTGLTSDEMIQRADEAMYQAKLMGKNRVVAWKNDL
ncbi:MAG: diguanylate cyclase [Bacillota bacterium]